MTMTQFGLREYGVGVSEYRKDVADHQQIANEHPLTHFFKSSPLDLRHRFFISRQSKLKDANEREGERKWQSSHPNLYMAHRILHCVLFI